MKLIILLFFLGLTACGMQGDLYLPEENAGTSTEKSADEKAIKN